MKRYKLSKDLPTFKAGDEFFISDAGNLVAGTPDKPKRLYFSDGDFSVRRHADLVAYTARALKEFPNILTEWFEEIPEKYKRYRPVKGDCYKCCGGKNVYNSCWTGVDIDEQRFNTGNCYSLDTPDEDIIHEQYEIPKALQTIKDDAKGFESDWQDEGQAKWYGYYDCRHKKLFCGHGFSCRHQGVVYFASEHNLEESFKNHRKEWLTVLGVKEK